MSVSARQSNNVADAICRARFLIPKVPLLLKTTASYALGLSDTYQKWDFKSEITIKLIRSFMNEPGTTSISKLQKLSIKDPGIKGKMWISKTELPPPEEEDALRLLLDAVKGLGDGLNLCQIPQVTAVEGEWTGYRFGADDRSLRLDLLEGEHYERLMRDIKTDLTMLYLHGGALYLLDPSGYRPICARLSKLTGGRCFSVRYRLAPQYPFPSALLDVFISYLSLLYPPPGSLHQPVPSDKLVVTGDSAGGNLSLALLQLLLQINRTATSSASGKPQSFNFHGHQISLPLPLPSGVALNSAWADLTASMPSVTTNLKFDYLPPLGAEHDRFQHIKPCKVWPASPERVDLYCEGPQLLHPLVSPLAAQDWRGSCPVWFGYGEECLVDEGRGVAGLMAKQDVKVEWWEFDAMPHCFCMVLIGTPISRLCYNKWAWFMRTVSGVNEEYRKTAKRASLSQSDASIIETKATFVEAQTLHESPLTLTEMSPFTVEEIGWRMQLAQRRRMEAEAQRRMESVAAKL